MLLWPINNFNFAIPKSEQVKIRQHDAEETVRQEVVTALVKIAKDNFANVSTDVLDIIKERTRDKKVGGEW